MEGMKTQIPLSKLDLQENCKQHSAYMNKVTWPKEQKYFTNNISTNSGL